MDEQMRQYLDEMNAMFGTKGWKHIVSEAEDAIEMRKEQLIEAKTLDEVRFMQGEIAQLRIIENLESIVSSKEMALKETEELETVG